MLWVLKSVLGRSVHKYTVQGRGGASLFRTSEHQDNNPKIYISGIGLSHQIRWIFCGIGFFAPKKRQIFAKCAMSLPLRTFIVDCSSRQSEIFLPTSDDVRLISVPWASNPWHCSRLNWLSEETELRWRSEFGVTAEQLSDCNSNKRINRKNKTKNQKIKTRYWMA